MSNSNAPAELAHFAFLIGAWRGEAKLKRDDGTWERFLVMWDGRYILDGYAIADEYRMTTQADELVVHGMNLRAYDRRRRAWNMKWLDARAGTWTDLGSEELGGVVIDEAGITYRMMEPMAGHRFTRATYTNISSDSFTWRGERSNDGSTWDEFLVVELRRKQ